MGSIASKASGKKQQQHPPADAPLPPAPAPPAGAAAAATTTAEPKRVVVLGGGNSAGYFAKEWLAQGGAGAELTIVGEEPVVSYERPALSKGYLTAGARLPGFHTCVGGGGERQVPEWYAEKGITFLTGAKVTKVDLARKTLTLSTGAQVSWSEALVVATGAKAVALSDFGTPGADLAGVLGLRDERDGAVLADAIKATKEANGQAVLVGGGYIGAEVAAALATNGVPTTIIMPEDRLFKRLFTPELAAFYEKVYQDKGVQIIKGAQLKSIQGTEGKVSGVEIEVGGERRVLPASLVVAGVGARANVELFKGDGGAALELAPAPVGGIKVDGHLRASAPGVYAIGDVAAFPQSHVLPGTAAGAGPLTRQEHVTHCRSSAAHVARHILGKAEQEYEYLPYFYSRVFNLSWQFWGLQGGSPEAEVVHFGEPDKPGAFWVWDGKVVGVFLESCTPEQAAAAKKVAAEQPPAPADLAAQGPAFLAAHA